MRNRLYEVGECMGLENNEDFKPKLIQDIEIKFLKKDERGNFYIIKSHRKPSFLKVHEVGMEIIKMLDGSTTVREIKRFLSSKGLEVDLCKFISILGEEGFLENYTYHKNYRLREEFRIHRFPLIKNPEKVLAKIHVFFSPFFKKILFYPFLVVNVIISVLFFIYCQLRSFELAEFLMINGSTWSAFALYFFIIIPFLGLIHEFAHSLACYSFGRKPGEIGLAIYFFAPTFYSDTSDAWMIDKSKRIIVFIAGPLVTLFIGNLCFLFYFIFQSKLLLMITFGSYLSVLFSFSPFVETDGYYILEALLSFPNLYSHMLKYASSWLKHKFGFLPESEYEEFLSSYSKGERKILAMYMPISLIMSCILLGVSVQWSVFLLNEFYQLTLAIFTGHLQTSTFIIWVSEGIFVFFILVYLISKISSITKKGRLHSFIN